MNHNTKILVVSSGKGGTGKSTVAIALAQSLVQDGYDVGLLDADITTPNIHTMLGHEHVQMEVETEGDRDSLIPVMIDNMKVLGVGFDVPRYKEVNWTGERIRGVVTEFIDTAKWGDPDYIVIDMPPGTSDAMRTILTGIKNPLCVVVANPSSTSVNDAGRTLNLLKRKDRTILGLIENRIIPIENKMVRDLATHFDVPYLGSIGSHPKISTYMDQGINIMFKIPDFIAIYDNIMGGLRRL